MSGAPLSPVSSVNESGADPQETGAGYRYRRRNAVSAEPLSSILAQPWDPPIHPKTPEELARIKAIVEKNILFSHLDEDDRTTVFMAMFPETVKAGELIIRQGDEGDNFYILDEGEAKVYKSEGGKEAQEILSYGPGDSFGELALMYDSPRAATVKAVTECKLWAVDRMSYKRILMGATVQKRNRWINFLNQAPILASLDHYERLRVADCLRPVDFKAGEVIIRQGDKGEDFYIVERGEVVCTKSTVEGELCRLGHKDYFGEIALLTDNPRAATVTAVTDTRCLALSREAFTRVLGDLQDLLKRNMANYSGFLSSI